MELGPRVVIAGTHSGVGKTTIASGLMAAFTRRGVRAAPAKVGPDFIDPGYHSLATGRPGRNIDPWLCGPDVIPSLAARAGTDADLLIVEGVMGLFDGAGDGALSSTADVATLLDAPVVLVVDAGGMSHSVAAVVHGFATLRPGVRVAGVICNRVGSPRHASMLAAALASIGVPMLGSLGRDDAFTWRDRHLGLVPVIEHPEQVRSALDRLASAIERDCDLDAIARLASTAPRRPVPAPPLPAPVASVRVAVARGRAFSFSYEDNLEALQAAGAELIAFDPCEDRRLPEGIQALVAGGGFPEVYADALAENVELLADLRTRAHEGLVVWAECGGLIWLAERLDERAMAGVVATTATMTDRLTLGYRRVQTSCPSPIGPSGTRLRGHEFHYSRVDPAGQPLAAVEPDGAPVGAWTDRTRFASYLHVHLGGTPSVAAEFVRCAARLDGAADNS